jgi:hypothetical protein
MSRTIMSRTIMSRTIMSRTIMLCGAYGTLTSLSAETMRGIALIAVPSLIAGVLLLWFVWRRVRAWQGRPGSGGAPPPPPAPPATPVA